MTREGEEGEEEGATVQLVACLANWCPWGSMDIYGSALLEQLKIEITNLGQTPQSHSVYTNP